MELYPAEEMWEVFMTDLPRTITIAMLAAIVGVASLFVLYDCLTSGRFQGLHRFAITASKALERIQLLSRPYDFHEEIKDLRAMNAAAGLGSIEILVPVEVGRKRVRRKELVGAGAFGRVFKVTLRDDRLCSHSHVIREPCLTSHRIRAQRL